MKNLETERSQSIKDIKDKGFSSSLIYSVRKNYFIK